MKRLAVSVIFFGMCIGQTAMAGIVNCNDSPAYCTALMTGANPYISVGNPTGTFVDMSNPTQINYSLTNVGIGEQAIGSLATGILTAADSTFSTYDDYDNVQISANDIFTLLGPAGSDGTFANVTATFTVSGTAALYAVGAYGSGLDSGGGASLELCGPGGSFACGGDQFNDTLYTGFGQPFFGYSGPLVSGNFGGVVDGTQDYLSHSYSWSQQVGQPFNVSYSMNAYTYGGSVYLNDPGTLSFNLPPGYSIESEGGFSTLPQSDAPEPAAATLLGLGLCAIGAFRLRRRAA